MASTTKKLSLSLHASMLPVADWGEKGAQDKKYPLASSYLRWILTPCVEDSLFLLYYISYWEPIPRKHSHDILQTWDIVLSLIPGCAVPLVDLWNLYRSWMEFNQWLILGDPGAVSRAGKENARRKYSSTSVIFRFLSWLNWLPLGLQGCQWLRIGQNFNCLLRH